MHLAGCSPKAAEPSNCDTGGQPGDVPTGIAGSGHQSGGATNSNGGESAGEGISHDDDLAGACVELGTLSGASTVSGQLGQLEDVRDIQDFFCFKLDAPSRVTVSTLDALAHLRAAKDSALDFGQTADLDKGDHLLFVYKGNDGAVARDYAVQVDVTEYAKLAPPLDADSDDPTDALDLAIDAQLGYARVGGYLGLDDTADVYRFEVGAGQIGNVSIATMGLDAVVLSAHVNDPAALGTPLQSKTAKQGAPQTLAGLTEGIHLLQVNPSGNTALYELTASLADAPAE